MSNEEMDRAIAEHLGWTRIWDPLFRQWMQMSPDGKNVTCDPDPNSGWDMSRIPNYSTDLNAMHEAEKALTTHNELHEYRMALGLDVKAPAEKRAQAFLRTIGKWRDA